MARAKDLAGQVVVVTGAARGIGALVARRLAARGARVALLGLEPGELAKVSASCGPGSRWWEVDVTDDRALADVARAFARVILPLMVTRLGARAMPQIESRWLATGAATQPFGPGGAADTTARGQAAPGTSSPGIPVTTKET